MVTLSSSDFPFICRVCLRVPPPKSPFIEVSPEVFDDFFGVLQDESVLEQENLPQLMCSGCYRKCEKWSKWLRTFQENHTILREILQREANETVETNDVVLEDDSAAVRTRAGRAKKRLKVEIIEETVEIMEVKDEEEEYMDSDTSREDVKLYQDNEVDESIEEKPTTTESEVHQLSEFFPLLKVECCICKEEYRHCEDYNTHLTEAHMGLDGNCPQCIGSSSFDSLDVFIAHMYSHSRFRFQCPKCPSKVSSRTNLQAHIRLQHKTHIFIKFRQCHICGTFQEGEQELRKHLLSHVPVDNRNCFMCNSHFESDRQLAIHLYTHAYSQIGKSCCEICGRVLKNQESLQNHMLTHEDMPRFKCDVCGNSYKTEKYLEHHKLKHSMEKTLNCSDCDKKFFFPRDLKTHMKQHGADSRSYICTHCGRGFLNASVLKEHTRIRHTGERPFPCDQCERSYFRKRELVEHQRSHTGEKPFCCEVCNRIYARKTTLMTHMKTHR